QCQDEPYEIEVSKEKWENIRYTLDKTSQTMKEDVLGSFSQYPLRLAWAITIHKSQGLTFDKAIIDAGEAFAPGQVYVALSRCTSLDGMVLKSKLRTNSLFTDQRIVQFSQKISSSQILKDELEAARKQYQEKILLSTFDFRLAINNVKELKNYLSENNSSFNKETTPWLDTIEEKLNAIQETALKFHYWLKGQFLLPGVPEENTALQERTIKAAHHFTVEIDEAISLLHKSPAITDSKLHAKEYNDALKEVFTELSGTKHLLQGFSGKLNVEAWHQRKKNFVLPSFAINAYAGASQKKSDSPHPILYHQLRKHRDTICSRKNLPIYLVLGSNTLDEMARYLPQSLTELRKISGFGDTKIEQYGQQFLDIILEYSHEHNLDSFMYEKAPKRERKRKISEDGTKDSGSKKKGETYAESFRLYKEGKSISEIAKERNLAISTIEGHLAKFVNSGDISINELVSSKKVVLIEAALIDFDGTSVNPVKAKLSDGISFGEIKLVMASLGIKQHRNKE
ncbi:MAG: helix-turn-helix domain-containing protein, partial [Chitinophagaceae bacterium]